MGVFLVKEIIKIVICLKINLVINLVAGIFSEEPSAVAYCDGLYSGGTLQHWYFSAVGIFSSQDNFFSSQQ